MQLSQIRSKISLGLQQSVLTIVGNAFSTLFSAVALIIISRVLGPQEFGEFSVGFAIVLIVTRVNDVGLSTILLKYLPRYKSAAERNSLINFSLAIKLIVFIVIGVLGLLISPWLITKLNFSQPIIIYTSFFIVIATVMYEQLLYTLQALHRFVGSIVMNSVQSVIKVLGILLFVLLQLKDVNLIFIFYSAVPIIPVLFFAKFLPKDFRLQPNLDIKKYQQLLTSVAPHAALSYLIAGIVENIDILFVRNYLSAYETGLLSGVSKISMFILLIAYSLGNVLYPRVARYQSSDHMKKYLIKASFLSLLCLVATAGFFPFSNFLIWLTVGSEYLSGSGILNVLAVSSFLTLASIPFIALFYAFDSPWLFSISAIGQLIIVLVGNALFVPTYGLEAAAYTKLISRLFLFGFSVIVGFYLYRRNYANANTP
ncbi:MAG: oligosaccharide flippase family protein [bacterium]|nr:oligosaccharide flippase family protein [bacterium]